MGFSVYDYRNDIRNVLVTPHIRSRFMKMEPGEIATPHTHDLGHEIFLVLQGRAVFEIDGESEELGPGQMCVALVDQMHRVRNSGDEPMIMYLSVTPHIQPTHTMWSDDGQRQPHRFVPNSSYDVETDTSIVVGDLIGRHVETARDVAEAAQAGAMKQEELGQKLVAAIAGGDEETARSTRDEMWDAMFPMFERAMDLADGWNDLAPRAETRTGA